MEESPDVFLLLSLFIIMILAPCATAAISLHVVDRPGNAATKRVFNGAVLKKKTS